MEFIRYGMHSHLPFPTLYMTAGWDEATNCITNASLPSISKLTFKSSDNYDADEIDEDADDNNDGDVGDDGDDDTEYEGYQRIRFDLILFVCHEIHVTCAWGSNLGPSVQVTTRPFSFVFFCINIFS